MPNKSPVRIACTNMAGRVGGIIGASIAIAMSREATITSGLRRPSLSDKRPEKNTASRVAGRVARARIGVSDVACAWLWAGRI